MNYTQYVATMRNLLVISDTGPGNDNFVQILPTMIDYAERRINKDLDLLGYYTSATGNASNGVRSITIPDAIDILDSAWVVTPAGTAPDAGTRAPLQRVTVEYMNYVWPQVTQTGTPQWIALLNTTTAYLAPTPNGAYRVEFVGLSEPAQLSAGTPETYISTNLTDLFIAASMVFGTGFQRDFGSQSDNPQASVSWESQYQALLSSAAIQELRRKAQSVSWTSDQPSALAKQSKT
ncbi:hypothetical protein [Ancylobacter sp.]|uniref:phage adaptor protein n=1 Tax=Ancylobacter sp. TaxID=1872567 RepID=UPI003BA9DC5D